MSTLTENLQQIYSIKQEIKEVIGTNSDLFSEYPDLISAAIADAGDEGLDWDDVATAGYIVPAGSINVNANGTVNVSAYANAVVNVPIPAGYIQPSGTITIDDNYNNTTVDVTSYAYANVQVSGGSGESGDPFHDAVGFSPELVEEIVPYVSTIIGDNFQVNEKGGNIDSIEYEYTQDDGKGGTWNIHVLLDSDPNDLFANSGDLDFSTYPDLYGNVFPIVANAVVTVSEKQNYDYLISGDLYTWNLMDNANKVETITKSGFIVNNGAAGFDIQVQGGLVPGVPANVFVSIRPGLTGNSNYPYFSPNESEDGAFQNVDMSSFVPFTDTYDASVFVHTLISDGFFTWGIDPNNFVSSIRNFVASDWDNGKVNPLSDLTCTTMVQEGNSSSECWCLVEGTLQNATDVCFKSGSGSWDSMGNQWMMDSNETLLECMPVVQKYKDPMSPYGWSTSKTQDGTYISLPAGPVKLYLHYQEGGDASNCDVYYCVYDSLNSQWTAKWYNMAETGAMTFVNPNA